jgi:ATP-dependent HslUV protease ATP-binding subunit HslU
MRKATMPLHREVNLLASLLLAPGDLSPDARRRLRALVLAAENLTTSFDEPLEELEPSLEPHFDAPALAGQTVRLDAAAVEARLGELAKNEDLSRYIL